MIPDLHTSAVRAPLGGEPQTLGVLRLSTEQGRQLGLRNEQTVRGVVDATGTHIQLDTEDAGPLLTLSGRAPALSEWLFLVRLGPLGVQLLPQRQLGSPVGSPAPTPAPARDEPPLPASVLPGRVASLMSLQTPLSALAALADPRTLRRLLQDAVPAAQRAAVDAALWHARDAITPDAVRSALLGSGFVTTRHGATPTFSIKKLLEQLRASADVGDSELSTGEYSALQDGIDALEAMQLQGLARQEAQEALYRFPMLFHDLPPAQLTLQRDAPQQEGASAAAVPWRVDLDLPLPDGQALEISVQWQARGELTLVLWTVDDALHAALREELGSLAQRLEDWDMLLGHCQIVLGERPAPSHTPRAAAAARLDCYT
jgi:hypothetical protein